VNPVAVGPEHEDQVLADVLAADIAGRQVVEPADAPGDGLGGAGRVARADRLERRQEGLSALGPSACALSRWPKRAALRPDPRGTSRRIHWELFVQTPALRGSKSGGGMNATATTDDQPTKFKGVSLVDG
jgi:hypothetical protein